MDESQAIHTHSAPTRLRLVLESLIYLIKEDYPDLALGKMARTWGTGALTPDHCAALAGLGTGNPEALSQWIDELFVEASGLQTVARLDENAVAYHPRLAALGYFDNRADGPVATTAASKPANGGSTPSPPASQHDVEEHVEEHLPMPLEPRAEFAIEGAMSQRSTPPSSPIADATPPDPVAGWLRGVFEDAGIGVGEITNPDGGSIPPAPAETKVDLLDALRESTAPADPHEKTMAQESEEPEPLSCRWECGCPAYRISSSGECVKCGTCHFNCCLGCEPEEDGKTKQ